MTLQSSGAISLDDMHVELSQSSGTECSINDSDIRGLIGKSDGATMAFNEWYGASNIRYITATGGTQYTSGNYRFHVFNSSATFNITQSAVGVSNTIDYMIIAGGGSGGTSLNSSYTANGGAGGGAGGYITGSFTASAGAKSVTVGGGGAQQTGGGTASGSNSSIAGVATATGGGGGGYYNQNVSGNARYQVRSGGSGGGGPMASGGGGYAGGSGTSGQGNDGSRGDFINHHFGSNRYHIGGAGGGGGKGSTPSPNSYYIYQVGNSVNMSHPGGTGSNTGVANYGSSSRGGGGGGGVHLAINLFWSSNSFPRPWGGGGTGGSSGSNLSGGGNGAVGEGGYDPNQYAFVYPIRAYPTSGSANTGGGGGGCINVALNSLTQYSGMAGGSGVVMVRYLYQ